MSSILVIEDDPAAARLLQTALGRNGHAVEVAGDLAAGRHAVEPGRHHLMILELFLPDGSGLDLLRYLRGDLGSTLPVLLLTGHRQDDLLARAEAAGASGYMTKPFDIRALLGAVDRLTG
jgi:two-component system, OmpR family, phosphate regulon response regulator PhoB